MAQTFKAARTPIQAIAILRGADLPVVGRFSRGGFSVKQDHTPDWVYGLRQIRVNYSPWEWDWNQGRRYPDYKKRDAFEKAKLKEAMKTFKAKGVKVKLFKDYDIRWEGRKRDRRVKHFTSWTLSLGNFKVQGM